MPDYKMSGGPFDGKTYQILSKPNELEFWLKTDGTLFDENGKVAQVARYSPLDDKDEFVFLRIDTSDDTLNKIEKELEADPRGKISRGLYAKPNYDIYTVKPTDEHKQVAIRHLHYSAEVDERIAPLVLEVWKRGWDTMGSCQERPKESQYSGMAYLDFPNPKHGREFVNILKASHIETTDGVNELNISKTRPDGHVRSIILGKMLVFLPTEDIEKVVEILRR